MVKQCDSVKDEAIVVFEVEYIDSLIYDLICVIGDALSDRGPLVFITYVPMTLSIQHFQPL